MSAAPCAVSSAFRDVFERFFTMFVRHACRFDAPPCRFIAAAADDYRQRRADYGAIIIMRAYGAAPTCRDMSVAAADARAPRTARYAFRRAHAEPPCARAAPCYAIAP